MRPDRRFNMLVSDNLPAAANPPLSGHHVDHDDWLLAALDVAARANAAAVEALEASARTFPQIGRQREAGVPLADIIDHTLAAGGQKLRTDAGRAIVDYQAAVMRLRAAIVRGMVEEAGMTLTAVAACLGLSRQKVSRLYHAASTAGENGSALEPVGSGPVALDERD